MFVLGIYVAPTEYVINLGAVLQELTGIRLKPLTSAGLFPPVK